MCGSVVDPPPTSGFAPSNGVPGRSGQRKARGLVIIGAALAHGARPGPPQRKRGILVISGQ
ncbi:hypothetical protein SZ55_4052 [Pseudomonas sp. FeS53a]|nr:hypothetical protein SZ55_4052 [Pseudomonas sp. FeS53a]